MRSLTEEETRTLFTKLASYTGRSLNSLITPAEDGSMSVFRLQGSRVYYVNKEIANLSISFPRDQLLSMGTMIGKYTKTGKFRINLTALDLLAQHARYKIAKLDPTSIAIHRQADAGEYLREEDTLFTT
ncbi:hypothetical protein DTO012A8_9452 [Penicillium roqueforti]|nr:hypothetical protein DTO012A8_9452 [Penicillium roqueforti]